MSELLWVLQFHSSIGQYAVTLTFTIMSMMMAKADACAENADVKESVTSTSSKWVSWAACSVHWLFYAVVLKLGITLKDLSFQFSWVMAGLDAAGGAMKFVGFAILMKVMMSGEMWGFLLARLRYVCYLQQYFRNLRSNSAAVCIRWYRNRTVRLPGKHENQK